ncbi:MAG: SapC family protein [Gammaproteobacteria bacterium]|nr:SapC family protein [Gammaproteobacteria bacterium]MBU1645680.1 SapC family protein [Gammaproteobacteria bacterium]MBU1970785.1 SapC family protein [Gammaproteobacteria bacterium]
MTLGGLGLYRDVTPLDSVLDAELCIQPVQDFGFARELKDCVITADEFAAACHSQPIVFTRGNDGRLFAAAVLALPGADGGNVFIEKSRLWRDGEYIPAFIRRYPFVPIMNGDKLALGIDRAYAGLSKTSGERLFENGQPTAFTQNVLQFMAEFQSAWDRTLALVKALDTLGLLEPFQVMARHEQRQQVLGGLMRVSEAKFNSLNDKDSLRLIRNSGLKLAVAQMLSLAQFEKLDRYARQQSPTPSN